MPITEIEVPSNALTAKFRQQGDFVDCYCIDIKKSIDLELFIKAFYTSRAFILERTLLSLLTLKPTFDRHAQLLAEGKQDTFSIWSVEERVKEQILLKEFTNHTKSWLMIHKWDSADITRLCFGSVVVANKVDTNGKGNFGLMFHLLGGFHRLYSRVLLNSAYRKLLQIQSV